jgi:membrane protease YdiL (CAAX protease family)
VIQVAGHCVHFFVVRRLEALGPGGPGLRGSPVMAWMPYAFYVTNVGPSLVAVAMTVFLYGLSGIRRLALQLSPWSVGGAWLVLAWLALPICPPPWPDIAFLAVIIGLLGILLLRGPAGIRQLWLPLRRRLLGASWHVLAACLLFPLAVLALQQAVVTDLGVAVRPGSWSLDSYLYGAVIGAGFIGPGLCEEIGWRGFALPHLQRRYSALVSSVIVGLAWALWHWPNFAIPSETPPLWQWLVFPPLTVAVAVIFTWAYNSTKGSLFAVIVLHGAYSTAMGLGPRPDSAAAWTRAIWPVVFFAVAATIVWLRGAASLSVHKRVVAWQESVADAGEPDENARPVDDREPQ